MKWFRQYKKSQPIENLYQIRKLFKFRMLSTVFIIGILSSLILLRLAYLDIYQYQQYHSLSKKNQISIKPLPPIRGLIFDRNGKLLARNIPVYNLEITPEKTVDLQATLLGLQKLIPSITENDIENFKRNLNHYHRFAPIPFLIKVEPKDIANFAVNQYLFPGVEIKAALMRDYPMGEAFSHIIGYVGRLNSTELNTVDPIDYKSTNFIGKVGIEKFYEPLLHGHVGYQEVETNAAGRALKIYKEKTAYSGHNLYLSIDSDLQIAAQNALKNLQGAIVAIDPQNGEVLALVSSPSYDANAFVRGISKTTYAALIQSKDRPLYNRSIHGQYPLASTIKPFLSLAALNENIVNEDFKIYDPGWYKLPNNQHKYRDWKRGGHGWIDIKKALIVSCDTYFYKLAELMGIKKIAAVLENFGFGHLTNIDLFEELPGLVPTPDWKRQIKKTAWYTGDTLISGIGQGFMLTTPLQLANATAAFANQGTYFQPHLLIKAFDPNRKTYHSINPKKVQSISYHKSAWETVTKAMHDVINSKHGTGFRFGKKPTYTVAAKTGTAQVYSLQQRRLNMNEIPKHLRDHSLFIGFAPIENPQIAIAVVVENDYLASFIARKVMDSYLLNRP